MNAQGSVAIAPPLARQFEIIVALLESPYREMFEELVSRYGQPGNEITAKGFGEKVYTKLNRPDEPVGKIGKAVNALRTKLCELANQHTWPYTIVLDHQTIYEGPRKVHRQAHYLRVSPNAEGQFELPRGFGSPKEIELLDFAWSAKIRTAGAASVERVRKVLHEVPVSIQAATKHSLEVCISPRGSWEIPAALKPLYAEIVKRTSQQKKLLASRPRYHNSNIWHVANFATHASNLDASPALSVDVARVTHQDYVATNKNLDLIVEDKGKKTTTRELLRRGWNRSPGNYFPPAANPLSIELLPLTVEPRKIVLLKTLDDEGVLRLDTVHGFVEAVLDGNRQAQHLPDPRETAFRKSYEMTGMALKHGTIEWMGLLLNGRTGYAALLGSASTTYSGEALQEVFSKRPKSFDRSELQLVALEPGAVDQAIHEFRPRESVTAALGLLLWKHGLAKINNDATF